MCGNLPHFACKKDDYITTPFEVKGVKFDVLLTVNLSIIFAIDQLNAQILVFFKKK